MTGRCPGWARRLPELRWTRALALGNPEHLADHRDRQLGAVAVHHIDHCGNVTGAGHLVEQLPRRCPAPVPEVPATARGEHRGHRLAVARVCSGFHQQRRRPFSGACGRVFLQAAGAARFGRFGPELDHPEVVRTQEFLRKTVIDGDVADPAADQGTGTRDTLAEFVVEGHRVGAPRDRLIIRACVAAGALPIAAEPPDHPCMASRCNRHCFTAPTLPPLGCWVCCCGGDSAAGRVRRIGDGSRRPGSGPRPTPTRPGDLQLHAAYRAG